MCEKIVFTIGHNIEWTWSDTFVLWRELESRTHKEFESEFRITFPHRCCCSETMNWFSLCFAKKKLSKISQVTAYVESATSNVPWVKPWVGAMFPCCFARCLMRLIAPIREVVKILIPVRSHWVFKILNVMSRKQRVETTLTDLIRALELQLMYNLWLSHFVVGMCMWFECKWVFNDRLMDYGKKITWIIASHTIRWRENSLNYFESKLTFNTSDYSSRTVYYSQHIGAVEEWKILK